MQNRSVPCLHQPIAVTSVTAMSRGERRTRWVILVAAVTMVAEIVAGYASESMALLADGWHMASHVVALGITAWAFAFARRHSGDAHFSFGTGKVGSLGGYTSAILLIFFAGLMVIESIAHLFDPVEIQFDEAILVAIVGLVVNLLSAWLLRDHHAHRHDSKHAHHHSHDHNLKGAYLHVLADALTSVLAISALLIGKFTGIVALDPIMGIVGGGIIARWGIQLLRESGNILLDRVVDIDWVNRAQEAVERDAGTWLSDLHVWRVSNGEYAASISVVAHDPKSPEDYKALLPRYPGLNHLTIEVNRCPES